VTFGSRVSLHPYFEVDQNLLLWALGPKLSGLIRGYSSGCFVYIFWCSIKRKCEIAIFLFNILMASPLDKFHDTLWQCERLCDDSKEAMA
jgi:hypothetical protein